jgi:hypothetical protein
VDKQHNKTLASKNKTKNSISPYLPFVAGALPRGSKLEGVAMDDPDTVHTVLRGLVAAFMLWRLLRFFWNESKRRRDAIIIEGTPTGPRPVWVPILAVIALVVIAAWAMT